MPRGTFQCHHPCDKPIQTHVSIESPLTLAGSFGPVSCVVTAPLLWVLVHAKFCLCPPRLECLFPSVLWKAYNQIPLALKAKFPGDSQSLCIIPRLGGLTWGSELSQQWDNFFGIIVLQLVVTQQMGMGFDFIVIEPFLSCCLAAASSLSLDIGYLFFVRFQCPAVDGCSTASCNFGALSGGDEHTSFYSTIFNWTLEGRLLTTGPRGKYCILSLQN